MTQEETHEEIEVIDVSLNEGEIDEMIAHLVELKEHKKNVQFPLASDLDLSVTFDESVEGDEIEDNSEKIESDSKMEEVKN